MRVQGRVPRIEAEMAEVAREHLAGRPVGNELLPVVTDEGRVLMHEDEIRRQLAELDREA